MTKKTAAKKPEITTQKAHYPNFVVTDKDHETTVDDDGETETFHTEHDALAAAKEIAAKHPGEVLRVYQLVIEVRCTVNEPTVMHVTDSNLPTKAKTP